MITDLNFNREDIIGGVECTAAAMETENVAAVATWAVDSTLAYVVDWLRERGSTEAADVLEQIGEVGI